MKEKTTFQKTLLCNCLAILFLTIGISNLWFISDVFNLWTSAVMEISAESLRHKRDFGLYIYLTFIIGIVSIFVFLSISAKTFFLSSSTYPLWLSVTDWITASVFVPVMCAVIVMAAKATALAPYVLDCDSHLFTENPKLAEFRNELLLKGTWILGFNFVGLVSFVVYFSARELRFTGRRTDGDVVNLTNI